MFRNLVNFQTSLTPALAMIAVLLFNEIAYANCAAGSDYLIEMSGSSVAVCLNSYNTGQCPDAGPMLRENADTGEVVALYTLCADTDTASPCYIDECVPKGTYRYGLETPFECVDAACTPTPFYEEFTVSADPENCSLSEGNTGPTHYSIPTPWAESEDGYVCASGYSSESGNSGCSVVPTNSRLILSVNSIAFLLGLLLLIRRRR